MPQEKKPEVSILVPARNDRTMDRLLRSLEKQTFKNFEVLIADDSDIPLKIERGKLSVRHFHTGRMTVSEKFNYMSKAARADRVLLTETGVVMPEDWLETMLSEYEEGMLLRAPQVAFPQDAAVNITSIMLPRKVMREVKHDTNLTFADDVDWMMALDMAGVKKKLTTKTQVYHYMDRHWKKQLKYLQNQDKMMKVENL